MTGRRRRSTSERTWVWSGLNSKLVANFDRQRSQNVIKSLGHHQFPQVSKVGVNLNPFTTDRQTDGPQLEELTIRE